MIHNYSLLYNTKEETTSKSNTFNAQSINITRSSLLSMKRHKETTKILLNTKYGFQLPKNTVKHNNRIFVGGSLPIKISA